MGGGVGEIDRAQNVVDIHVALRGAGGCAKRARSLLNNGFLLLEAGRKRLGNLAAPPKRGRFQRLDGVARRPSSVPVAPDIPIDAVRVWPVRLDGNCRE